MASALALAGLASGCATLPPPGPPRTRPYVDCRGPRTPAPTVVLESGAFGTSADWDRVERDLARTTRVCAYDRAGLGRSPPADQGRDAEAIARALAGLLDRLGETRPVILVGHSNGALYAEAFATLFPERTAGVAYVNGVGVDDLDDTALMDELHGEERQARVAVLGQRLGLAPLVAPHMVQALGLEGPAAAHKLASLTSAHHIEASREEVLQVIPSLARLRAAGGPPTTIPTVSVISTPRHPDELSMAWRKAEAAPARRACQGWVLDVADGSHVSPLGRDRAYVEGAILWLQTPGLKAAPSCTGEAYK